MDALFDNAPPKRGRGRPRKSVDVAAQRQRLGFDQFAAVRAYLQGLRVEDACTRYLVSQEPPSGEAPALTQISRLLTTIAGAAEQHPSDMTAHAAAALRQRAKEADERRQQLVRIASRERSRRQALAGGNALPSPAGTSASVADDLPDHLLSLDAFQEHYVASHGDPMWSEGDWQDALDEAAQDWRSAGGRAPAAPLDAPLGAIGHMRLEASLEIVPTQRPPIVDLAGSVRALEQCRHLVERKPEPGDLVAAWFTPSTAKRLREADLPTLYTLCEAVNARGTSWWRRVQGLGPVRAGRVLAWLQWAALECGLPLDKEALTANVSAIWEREARAAIALAPQFSELAVHGLEPLALALGGEQLDGRDGIYRQEVNLLGAKNDLQAIIAALGKYASKPRTRDLYALEISRFVLWAWREQKKPLSSISIQDARAYRDFLHAIPREWINADAVPRTSPSWRPFRKQLGRSSIRTSLTIVNAVMSQLHQTGYLLGNPFAGVTKESNLPAPKLDPARSLSPTEWALVEEMLDQQPSPARRAALQLLAASEPDRADGLLRLEEAKGRRLRALVQLLHKTGIRRAELATARLGGFERVQEGDEMTWGLWVTGKRSKTRLVPVPDDVLELVREHLRDRPMLGFHDDIASPDRIPLISVLSIGLPNAGGRTLQLEFEESQTQDSIGALSADGIYKMLKTFFAHCALEARRRGMDDSHLRRASTHWLRHTAARELLDGSCDIRSAQQFLGHADARSLSHYTKPGHGQLFRDVLQARAKQVVANHPATPKEETHRVKP